MMDSPLLHNLQSAGLASSGKNITSPWQDVAANYAPTNMRAALLLCETLFLRNGVYKAAAERVVDYFLTKPLFKGQDDKNRKKFERMMSSDFGVIQKLREVGIDRACYGNAFVSIHLPFTRVLRCANCKSEIRMMDEYGRTVDFSFSAVDFSFHRKCNKCKTITRHFIKDRPDRNASKISLVRLDPKKVTIEMNEISETARYWLEIDPVMAGRVRNGDPFLLATTPAPYLAAIKAGSYYLFNSNRILHLRQTSLAGVRLRGWGIPPILSSFRQLFRLQLLYRYDEVMKMDYVVPLRIMSPAIMKSSAGNTVMEINLRNFANEAMNAVSRHRVDGTDWNFFPFPVNYQAIGGEGQQLDQAQRDTIANEEDRLLNVLGIPPELYRGSMTLVNAPVGLRLFEAGHSSLVRDLNRTLQWTSSIISNFMNSGDYEAELERVTLTDNLDDKAWRIQAAMTGAISRETGLSPIGIDAREESRRILDEQMLQQRMQSEAEQQMQMEALSLGDSATAGEDNAASSGQQGGGMTPMDLEAQGDETARVLLDPNMPEQHRRQQLASLRQTNPTLHAVVLKKMDQYRNQAGTIGQQQGLMQMGIGTPQQ